MPDRSEQELFQDIHRGDDTAFERVYDRYHHKARLMAWHISHRADWVDDLLNETWCRAFRLRKSYNPDRPFPHWLAGILQNVYREHCRKSPTTFDGDPDEATPVAPALHAETPEALAANAELLAELNDCVALLDDRDSQIIRLRFFEGLTLRAIATEVTIPEATIREVRIPAALAAIRRCLRKKGIRDSEVFPAQGTDERQ